MIILIGLLCQSRFMPTKADKYLLGSHQAYWLYLWSRLKICLVLFCLILDQWYTFDMLIIHILYYQHWEKSSATNFWSCQSLENLLLVTEKFMPTEQFKCSFYCQLNICMIIQFILWLIRIRTQPLKFGAIFWFRGLSHVE